MAASNYFRSAAGVALGAAILAACGGAQNQVPAATTFGSGGSAAERVSRAYDADGPLLYVVHRVRNDTDSVISILSLRQHKELTRITGYRLVGGVCSDASGNVWVTNRHDNRWYVDEFSHGGTNPTHELEAPHVTLASCAVDPSSGDLAVMCTSIDGGWEALIWRGAQKGKPAEYHVPLLPLYAAYDDTGDLFITGPAGYSISEYYFAFGELAKGSSSVQKITLDKSTGHWGAVQWDGTYVVVNTTESHHLQQPVIYRVQVSGTNGDVVGVVRPHGFYGGIYPSSPVFVLHDHALIGTWGKNGEAVWAWPYPAGGTPTRRIAKYEVINAIALSQ
jgi:hypothetical protein